MASNFPLIAVKNRGWLNGFSNLFRKESHAWWGSLSWLVKMFVWIAIVDGILAIVTLVPSINAANETDQSPSGFKEPLEETALGIFFMMASMIPACGVIILGQDTIIDERIMGTAAWVLSKPVSRAAFLLSKLSAKAIGILGTMVLAQGFVAYIICKVAVGISLSIPGFLAGLGLVYLILIFMLALTLMLGTLFHSRGPVVGIPLAFVAGIYLWGIVPWLGNFMPTNLIIDLGSARPSLAVALAQGQPLPTVTPLIGTVILTLIFTLVALWRFQREEF
jgi:ABC-2 type transport system permease protein